MLNLENISTVTPKKCFWNIQHCYCKNRCIWQHAGFLQGRISSNEQRLNPGKLHLPHSLRLWDERADQSELTWQDVWQTRNIQSFL